MAERARPPVQIVYALPDEQRIVDIEHRAGLTAVKAVAESGLRETFPEIAGRPLVLGVFGVQVELDHLVAPGDRVEICRPLVADPRDMRRAFAASGQVMGGARREQDGQVGGCNARSRSSRTTRSSSK